MLDEIGLGLTLIPASMFLFGVEAFAFGLQAYGAWEPRV